MLHLVLGVATQAEQHIFMRGTFGTLTFYSAIIALKVQSAKSATVAIHCFYCMPHNKDFFR